MMDFFSFPAIVLNLTTRCNLKCRRCIVRIPYLKHGDNDFVSVYDVEKTMSALFSSSDASWSGMGEGWGGGGVIDYVNKLEVLGGEVFLLKDLTVIISAIMKYKEKFDYLRVTTNGSIMVKDNLLDTLKKYNDKIEVFISDYGLVSRCADEIERVLLDNNIECIRRKYYGDFQEYGGWIDAGDFSLREYKQSDIEDVYKNCGAVQSNKCWMLWQGELHKCSRSAIGKLHGIEPMKNKDYIDMFDDSTTNEQKRSALKNLMKVNSISACAYCNGYGRSGKLAKRYPAAEQLD